MISMITYPFKHVMIAACAAYRLNDNNYVKAEHWPSPPSTTKSNKEWVSQFLMGRSPEPLTAQDYETAEKCINYLKGMMFRQISGDVFTSMEESILTRSKLIDGEVPTSDLGLMSYVPAYCIRKMAQDEAKARLNFATGTYFGAVGEKTECTGTVLQHNYSTMYNVWYLTVMTDSDSPCLFSYKTKIEIGSRVHIKGTVTAHKDNLTRLNRVKLEVI